MWKRKDLRKLRKCLGTVCGPVCFVFSALGQNENYTWRSELTPHFREIFSPRLLLCLNGLEVDTFWKCFDWRDGMELGRQLYDNVYQVTCRPEKGRLPEVVQPRGKPGHLATICAMFLKLLLLFSEFS